MTNLGVAPPFSSLRVQVEVTTHCNVQCKMCVRPKMIRKIGPRHMEWGVFEQVVEQSPAGAKFCLQGTGEPFLHPDFYRMVERCKDRGFYVETYTNGLPYEPAQVVESGLDMLMISILGSTVETSDRRIRHGDFAKVLSNLASVHELKASRGAGPKLAFNVCVMRENLAELPEVIELAAAHGVSYVQFTPVGDHPHFQAPAAEFEEVAQALRSAAEARQIRIHIPPIERGQVKRYATCIWPWNGYYVTVDGRVAPCCTRPHLDCAYIPGHALEIADMESVWHGEDYREFRRALATREADTVPPMCRACVEYDFG